MKLALLLLTALATLGSSASLRKRGRSWPAAVRTYFETVGEELKSIGASTSGRPVCDFSSADMPTADSFPLPPPAEGLSVYHVAVGRGTQNYTCSTPSATPTPFGAVAGLYNASCLAGKFSTVLNLIAPAALSFPTPSEPTLFPANLALSGHHYFPDAKTPVFNFRTHRSNYGIYYAKKVANTTAPAGAAAGPDGAPAVPWLKLAVIDPPIDASADDVAGNVKEIYRVNTAGGSPPTSCEGQPTTFQVEYSAEYWFWAPSQ
jgi:hypothetical protein